MNDARVKIVCTWITALSTIIGSVSSGLISYNQGYNQGYADATRDKVSQQVESSDFGDSKSEQDNNLSEEISDGNKNYDVPPSVCIPEETSDIQTDNTKEQNDNIPSLIAVSWKDESAYETFSGNGNNGFVMFGNTYTEGFTISMGASYNMWGSGEQYITYNIESISRNFSTLKILAGHVDGYSSDDIVVQIYLDKTLEETPEYEYTISPATRPQTLSVDITEKAAMTIQVSNQGGDTNKIGFANPTFE